MILQIWIYLLLYKNHCNRLNILTKNQWIYNIWKIIIQIVEKNLRIGVVYFRRKLNMDSERRMIYRCARSLTRETKQRFIIMIAIVYYDYINMYAHVNIVSIKLLIIIFLSNFIWMKCQRARYINYIWWINKSQNW